MTTTRMAGERLALNIGQIREFFGGQGNFLGEGRQGAVVASPDLLFAIKRQPLTRSDKERQARTDHSTAAYMTAKIGTEGFGPKVYGYEIDPTTGHSYLVMDNLASKGYKTLEEMQKTGMSQDEYRGIYARQMLLEAEAAAKGIDIRDSHSGNVMVDPSTGKIMFIDQGFSLPLITKKDQARAQVSRAELGVMNLDLDDQIEKFRKRNEELRRGAKDPSALAAQTIDEYRALLASRGML